MKIKGPYCLKFANLITLLTDLAPQMIDRMLIAIINITLFISYYNYDINNAINKDKLGFKKNQNGHSIMAKALKLLIFCQEIFFLLK
jgi:hypothetical protein